MQFAHRRLTSFVLLVGWFEGTDSGRIIVIRRHKASERAALVVYSRSRLARSTEAQRYAGYAPLSTLLDVYSHFVPSEQTDSIECLAGKVLG
jgi:hypothetical protein